MSSMPAKNALLSLPVRGAWVEIIDGTGYVSVMSSLPVRGAWVEMSPPLLKSLIRVWVAPRAGSVG